jgi:hypothetical protein
MILYKLAKLITDQMSDISNISWNRRAHELEVVGKLKEDEMLGDPIYASKEYSIMTIQIKPFIPMKEYGYNGYRYESGETRKIKGKGKITKPVTRYMLTKGEETFIYNSYVKYHLNQRQISKLSTIPQQYVNQYIKKNKLVPRYDNTLNDIKSDYETNLMLNKAFDTNIKNIIPVQDEGRVS